MNEAFEIFSAYYELHLTDLTRPYPGAVETLDILSNMGPMYVVSNKSEGFTRKILENLDLSDYFREVVGGDTLAKKKPDPGCVDFILQRQNVKRENLIIVGDNYTDLETARRAEIRSIYCTFGYGVIRDNTPDAVANLFSEIPGLIESL